MMQAYIRYTGNGKEHGKYCMIRGLGLGRMEKSMENASVLGV